jgi:D-psicose/D-tagatose/L-ribulose 3-epimerase
MRKVGIFYAFWQTEWDADFIPYVARVKRLGFDQLEVNAGGVTETTSAARRELAAVARDAGIALSYGIGLPPRRDVSSPDEGVRREGIAFMRRLIDAIAEMGGGTCAGTVHSCWPTTLPKGYADKRPFLEQSLKSMRELVKPAEDRGVTRCIVVINRFEQFLVNTAAEAVAYVEQIRSPACKILLDTFHMNIEEDSIGGAIRHTGKHLAQLHVGETNRKPPGLGHQPWGEIKAALDDIGFQGALVLEPFVMPGGQIGRDIGVWREVVPHPDLDELARAGCAFTKAHVA